MDDGLGRIDVSSVNFGKILEIDQIRSSRNTDQSTLQILDGFKTACRLQCDLLFSCADISPRDDDVLALQYIDELRCRKSHFCQAGIVVFNEYPFFLCPVNLDFGDIIDEQQLISYFIGHFFKLCIRKSFPGDRDDRAEYIAEFVVNERPDHTIWQFSFGLFHFTPQAIPDRTHLFIALFNVCKNNRDTRSGFAGDKIKLRHFLDRFLQLIRD